MILHKLKEDEMEAAIVVSRLSDDLLYRYLGLALRCENNSSLFLLLELLSNSAQSALTELEREGRAYSQELLMSVKDLVCDKYEFCIRRKSLGLGDPRLFIDWIANILVSEGIICSKSILTIPVSVIFIRSQLSNLCDCEHRIGEKP
jgi:hypothetical protein